MVIDDIRDISVWEMIKDALISNNRGSGIIATTCKVDVAESIGGVYRLPLLSDKDSKILFYRRISFDSEEGCPPEYRELSKIILNKCSRLPLAIISITSLLLNSLNSKAEWEKVCNSVGSGIELGDRVEDMRRILSRTYNDLPQHLRECFLYLHIFPQDHVIRRDVLVQRWLSEGLIHDHELGESYFYQLLNTGMIQPTEFDNDGKALACRVPVVMMDLIAYLLIEEEKRSLEKENEETEEKSALQKASEAPKKETERKHTTTRASQGRTNLLHKVERLSLQLQVSKEQHDVTKVTKPLGAAEKKTTIWKEITKYSQQGSLSITRSADSMDALPIFKHLHVLILEGSMENRHITNKYLGRLRKLRYLILASTQITAIPKKVGNLRSLQTLDLRATSVNELPCKFVELRQLRCLLVNRSTKVPSGICTLQALEQLEDINIGRSPDILEDICTLPKLRFLKITLWSWDESSSKLLPETLCKLSSTKLKHISICTSCSLEFEPTDIQKAFQHIEKLVIQHSTFDTTPAWLNKLERLSSLSIEVYLLEESALRILGGLPALLFLSLAEKKTPEERPTAKRTPEGRVVTEDKLVIRSKGFGNLKTFHLFSRAMGIKFEEGSMEKLERLKLSFQASLTVDDFCFGLDNLSSLKHVQVEIICFSTTEKVVKKAEDAIRRMIWGSPKLPRPALDIRRSAEEYMVEEKREFDKKLFLASWDGRTASVQK